MDYILNIVQMVIAVFLITLILFQQRGAGLGGAFGGGGGGGEGGIYYKKRGMEKLIFTTSIILAILFILTAFVRMLL